MFPHRNSEIADEKYAGPTREAPARRSGVRAHSRSRLRSKKARVVCQGSRTALTTTRASYRCPRTHQTPWSGCGNGPDGIARRGHSTSSGRYIRRAIRSQAPLTTVPDQDWMLQQRHRGNHIPRETGSRPARARATRPGAAAPSPTSCASYRSSVRLMRKTVDSAIKTSP
jgi:hypothetical protein